MLREHNSGSQAASIKEATVLKQASLDLPLAARIKTGWTVYGVLISFYNICEAKYFSFLL